MNQIVRTTEALAMTSREIAELTGKEHKHVLTDIRNMLEQLGMHSAGFSAQYKDSTGRMLPCFNLPKDLTITLISGYNVTMRHRIVTRWQELEANQGLALTKSLPEALRLAAQAMEDAERAQTEKLEVESRLRIESEKVGHLAEQVAVAQPKADALDRIALDSESSFTLRQSAAQLQMQEKAFLAWMHTSGLIYRSESGVWHAYAEPRRRLWLEHKLYPYIDSKDGETRHRTQVRVTARGMAKLAEMLEKEVVA